MALPTIGSGYNSSIGTRLSSVDNKTAEYYNIKTGQGFGDPNALSSFVNQNFNGVNTNSQNIFSTLAGSYTNPVLQPSQIAPTQSLSLPASNTPNSLNKADASVAGAVASGNNIQSYLDKLAVPASATPESTAAKAITDRLTDLYGQDVGKTSALNAAEQTAGVPDMQKQLQDITNSINVKNAEYEKLNTDISGKPIPLGLIRGEQAQVRLQQASEINLLSARAQALQGNISLAKETAAKAVDLKYSTIEDEITAKEKQLQVIQPLLSAEERKIAAAQQLSLDEQKQEIATQKSAQLNNINLALDLGITTPYANRNGEFYDTRSGVAYPTEQSFFQAAGVSSFAEAYDRNLVTTITPEMLNPPKTASTSSTHTAPSSPTSGYKFTSTQLNHGANNAGVNLDTFKTLDPDVQNYFVSSSQTVLSSINDALSQVSTGAVSLNDFNTAVDANQIPQSVKDYLKRLASTRAPKTSSGTSDSSSSKGLGFWGGLLDATEKYLGLKPIK